MPVTKVEAIQSFLENKSAMPYTRDMEVQVSVIQADGSLITGEYKGRDWRGWSNGTDTWKAFRIPYQAMTDPTYDMSSPMTYPLDRYADKIGLTGWDWTRKKSLWVGFDVDSLIDHKAGITESDIDDIIKEASTIPWVELRRSTSGRGLHLYVKLEPVDTATHTEHAAVARYVLDQISALIGQDFQGKVDVYGGILWVWSRTCNDNSFELIKASSERFVVSDKWRNHVGVISTRTGKSEGVSVSGFAALATSYKWRKLTDQHKKLVKWMEKNKHPWWWDRDHHCLVTHTLILDKAHEELELDGFFETKSTGSSTQNCFMFPVNNGWVVRRFSKGCQEHRSWVQDKGSWTKCFFDCYPDFPTACATYGGLEDARGGFNFRTVQECLDTMQLLGVAIDQFQSALIRCGSRPCHLVRTPKGKLLLEIPVEDSDTEIPDGWMKEKKKYQKVVAYSGIKEMYETFVTYDDTIRHIVSNSQADMGWAVREDTSAAWRREPISHIRLILAADGHKKEEIDVMLGNSINRCWTLVHYPFQDEYPGDRLWNMSKAQLAMQPSQKDPKGKFDTWQKILNHCGGGLDEAVGRDKWCKANGIRTGSDYLLCWIAAVFQNPEQPLPYLFFYGPQNSGKSMFHESLSILLKGGHMRASAAMVNQSGFNAELEDCVICVIEETDLRVNTASAERVKDWVTAREILIHPKGKTPYLAANYTHWVHCANDHQFCPVFPGDTRIVIGAVPEISPIDLVPKFIMEQKLSDEAPYFLAAILHLDLPPTDSRLRIPVIDTASKLTIASASMTELDAFINEHCVQCKGATVKFSEFFDRFRMTLVDVSKWTKHRVSKSLPPDKYVKGRSRADNQLYIGNMAWMEDDKVDALFHWTMDSDGTHITKVVPE